MVVHSDPGPMELNPPVHKAGKGQWQFSYSINQLFSRSRYVAGKLRLISRTDSKDGPNGETKDTRAKATLAIRL